MMEMEQQYVEQGQQEGEEMEVSSHDQCDFLSVARFLVVTVTTM